MHLLCTYHFQQKSVLVANGMSPELKATFINDVVYLLYYSWKHVFSEDEYDVKFKSMQEKCIAYPKVTKFLRGIEENKKKVVSYYTQCHFTAGAFTSQ